MDRRTCDGRVVRVVTAGALALASCGTPRTGGLREEEATVRMDTRAIGEGAPLVLVGGGLTGYHSWEPHAAALAKTRRVIRAQPLSVQYGLEGRPLPEGYSVRMESQALAAAIDDLGLRDAIDICAWSFGALVALDYALEHPDRIRTLTLIEPPGFWVLREHGHVDDEVRSAQRVLEALHGDITEEMLATFVTQVSIVPPGVSPREAPQWPVWTRHRQSLRNCRAVIAHADARARLRALHVPVLLVKGTGSQRFLHRIVDDLATDLPNAEVLELPAGHAPHLVSMDAFLDRLATFQAPAVTL